MGILANSSWHLSQKFDLLHDFKQELHAAMLNVTFFMCRQMLGTSVTLPLEQLRAAEALASADQPRRSRKSSLCVKLASIDGEPVKTHTGITLVPDAAINDIHQTDLLLLPALWRNPRPVLASNSNAMPWFRRHYENGSLIAGVGTGCFLMAEAGLLDGKAATTHWHYFDEFQARYPNVSLKRQYFITQAGNLYCTGSVNSMADLMIHFIQRFFSRSIASHVERHFFHEIRRAYESSVSYQDSIAAHPDEDILQIQIWIQDNHNKEINFKDLADQFGMSLRTFNRRFKNATGSTPLHHLQRIRMESAKDLLKTTNLSIGEVMYKVGYQDHTHFTALFRKHNDTTPGQYRTTVRAKLFNL